MPNLLPDLPTLGQFPQQAARHKPRPRVLVKRTKALEAQRVKRDATAFVRKRDGGKCRACRKPGNQSHHVVYRSHGGKDEPRNLIYVCTSCHQLIHAKALLLTFDPKHPAKSVTFTRNTAWDKETRSR